MTSISKPLDNVNQIASKDRAETFQEADVTVSTTNVGVQNESVTFTSDTIESTTTTRPEDDATNTFESTPYGLRVKPNIDLAGVRLEQAANSTSSLTYYVYRVSDGQQLLEQYNNGSTVTLQVDLDAGTEYNIVGTATNVDLGYYSTPSFPYTSDSLDITNGAVGSTGTVDDAYIFKSVTGLEPLTDGTATVEWPQPPDVYRWDAATFTTSPDGETVNVFVEESTDGGSTWTEIAGPISRGQDISAVPDSRCRFRVDLSRSDTTNSPSLDSIYRRWVV